MAARIALPQKRAKSGTV